MSPDRDPATKQAVCRFMTTRWSDVMSARGNSAAARQSLSELCERYYAPVQAFIRAYTGNEQEARDWTHSFFAKLLEGHSLDSLRPEQVRFRSYLLGAVKHFIADERDKAASRKRGGTATHVPLDADSVEISSASLVSRMPEDAYFDRQWALTILDQSLEELRNRVASTQLGRYFDHLKHCLIADVSSADRESMATSVGMSPENLKQVLHRWRKQFREIVKAAVQGTVSRPGEVDGEMHYLIKCLSYRNDSTSI